MQSTSINYKYNYINLKSDFVYEVLDFNVKIVFIYRAGVLNSKLEYGVEKKVSKLNTFAASVQIDVINGVTLKIK